MMYNRFNQKVSINIEDYFYVGKIPYSIYDESGKQICKEGEILTENAKRALKDKKLFRAATYDEIIKSSNIISRISEEMTEKLISTTSEHLESIEEAKKIALETFYKKRDHIFEAIENASHNVESTRGLKVYYNEYYCSHVVNVSTLSTALGLQLGLNKEELQTLTLGSLLHDVGMTRISQDIINKPGKLSPDEFEMIMFHPRIGYKIVKEEYMMAEKIAIIALQHQERYNGSGYPARLKGDEINYLAQIVSVADVFDAASSNKVYANSKSPQRVIKEMSILSNNYNPKILNCLKKLLGYSD